MLGIPAGQGDGLATCGPLGTAERHANAPSPHGTPFDDLAKDFHEEAHPEEGGEVRAESREHPRRESDHAHPMHARARGVS